MPEPGVSCRIGPFTRERRRQALLLGEAERYLADRGLTARRTAAVGDPACETLAAAQAIEADLIIVGGRHRRRPWSVGSPEERIARRAGCDVLVVHGGRPG